VGFCCVPTDRRRRWKRLASPHDEIPAFTSRGSLLAFDEEIKKS
jgi:hypothetical protein